MSKRKPVKQPSPATRVLEIYREANRTRDHDRFIRARVWILKFIGQGGAEPAWIDRDERREFMRAVNSTWDEWYFKYPHVDPFDAL